MKFARVKHRSGYFKYETAQQSFAMFHVLFIQRFGIIGRMQSMNLWKRLFSRGKQKQTDLQSS